MTLAPSPMPHTWWHIAWPQTLVPDSMPQEAQRACFDKRGCRLAWPPRWRHMQQPQALTGQLGASRVRGLVMGVATTRQRAMMGCYAPQTHGHELQTHVRTHQHVANQAVLDDQQLPHKRALERMLGGSSRASSHQARPPHGWMWLHQKSRSGSRVLCRYGCR